MEIEWSDFYKDPEPKPKGDTTGPTSFFDNPYLNDDSINLDYTKAFQKTDWKNSVKQAAQYWGQSVEDYAAAQRDAVEYNYKANAPDDKEGLAESLAIWDHENLKETFIDYDAAWDYEKSRAQRIHDKVAREQTELWNALKYGIDNPDITGGLTEEGKADYEFLKQYRVKEGGNPFVDGAREQWMEQFEIAGREPGKDDAPYRPGPKPGDPDYTPPPSFPGQDIPKFEIADAGIPRTADWTGEGRPAAPESGYKWYPTNNPNDPGGGFWSPDLNHEKWKVENLGGEIGQIASSEGLQPGMIPSLQDNLARDTKQQRLAQETGTAIRQLETDQRSSEPTLAERLQNIPSLGSNIPGLPTGIGSNFIKTANDYLNIGSTAEKSRWGPIDMLKDEFTQRGKPGDGTKGGWDPTRGLRPGVPSSQGGFGSGPTELARRALKTGGRLAKGAANLGVGIAADWAADKFLMPHVERAGQRMGKSLKNWANEFDARGSQYNPTLNRNVLRIPN